MEANTFSCSEYLHCHKFHLFCQVFVTFQVYSSHRLNFSLIGGYPVNRAPEAEGCFHVLEMKITGPVGMAQKFISMCLI